MIETTTYVEPNHPVMVGVTHAPVRHMSSGSGLRTTLNSLSENGHRIISVSHRTLGEFVEYLIVTEI